MNLKGKFLQGLILIIYCLLISCSTGINQDTAKKQPTIKKVTVKITGDKVLNVSLSSVAPTIGRVSDSKGNPLEGVAVAALNQKWPQFISSMASTDKNGNYNIYLYRGTYDFRFEPPSPSQDFWSDYPAADSRATTLRLKDRTIPRTTPLWVKLPDGFFFQGTMKDYKGNIAMGNAFYAFNTVTENIYVGIGNFETGKYKVSVPNGNYELNAIRMLSLLGDKFPDFTNKDLGKRSISKDTTLNATMPKGVVVQGLVKDKNGKIVIADLNFINYADSKNKKPWVRSTHVISFVAPESALNDEAVKVSFMAGLEKGTYNIQVMPLQIKGFEVEYSARATLTVIKKINIKKNKKLDIGLDEGKILSGKVTDKKKKGLASVLIIVTNIKNYKDYLNFRKNFMFTMTDDNGNYSVPLPPGKWYVYFMPTPEDLAGDSNVLLRSCLQDGIDRSEAEFLLKNVLSRFRY